MKLYIKIFVMLSLVVTQSAYAGKAALKVGGSNACFALKNAGAPNDFYFCGQQSTSCAGVTYNKNRSKTHWYYDAGYAYAKDDYEDRTRHFVCCGGSGSSEGKWVEITDIQNAHPTWGSYRKTENYDRKKSLTGGTCNQQVYDNVCGGVSIAKDCNTPDSCNSGYIQRTEGGACVKVCAAGKGFASATSNKCVDCKASLRQGVDKNGICVRCEPNEFYNLGKQGCVPFNEMAQVSDTAHKECWLCGSEGAMLECFRRVSQSGSLANVTGTNADKLKGACSLEGINANDFKLPADAIAVVDEEETTTNQNTLHLESATIQ